MKDLVSSVSSGNLYRELILTEARIRRHLERAPIAPYEVADCVRRVSRFRPPLAEPQ